MKTLIIIIAFTGFTAVSGYAQNRDCNRTGKVAKTALKAAPTVWVNREEQQAVLEPCTRYRKNNIVVTQCPGTFYDNSDVNGYELESQNAYMGYFPKIIGEDRFDPNGPLAPQQNNYKNTGLAPFGGNEWNSGYSPE